MQIIKDLIEEKRSFTIIKDGSAVKEGVEVPARHYLNFFVEKGVYSITTEMAGSNKIYESKGEFETLSAEGDEESLSLFDQESHIVGILVEDDFKLIKR